MDELFVIMLVAVALGAVVSITAPLFFHGSYHQSYPMGINITHVNESVCRFTWLGGIDYDSFIRDIAVNNVSIGHPEPMSVIHVGDCNSTISMYFMDVHTYKTLWPKGAM